jgi:hypothetical protein
MCHAVPFGEALRQFAPKNTAEGELDVGLEKEPIVPQ